MLNKVWNDITYPFPDFNGATVEVWEWISNFISHFIMDVITYPCWDYSQGVCSCTPHPHIPLQWRHNGHNSVPNHQPYDCLLNRLFRRRSKNTSKLRATGLCAGNSPGTGEFPAQMASYTENVSIWWRHHASRNCFTVQTGCPESFGITIMQLGCVGGYYLNVIGTANVVSRTAGEVTCPNPTFNPDSCQRTNVTVTAELRYVCNGKETCYASVMPSALNCGATFANGRQYFYVEYRCIRGRRSILK